MSETYFLRVGPQGRLFTSLEADDAGGSEETGFVKLAHTSKLLNRGMGVIHQLMPDGSSSFGTAATNHHHAYPAGPGRPPQRMARSYIPVCNYA